MTCFHACVIKSCKSNYRNRTLFSGITFHEFPFSAERREIWINAVQLATPPNWGPSRYSYVCSAHFHESDFYTTNKGLRRLKTTAIPKLLDTDAGGSECDQELDILEVKEVILRVYRYLQTEYEQLKQLTGHSCDLSPLANILKRTAAATGVSEHTVTSLLEHDQPPDEETFDDDANAKRLRLDNHLDDDLDQKEHIRLEQFETETEQEHYGQKEQNNYNITETLPIEYERDYDKTMEHKPLEQTLQEQTLQEQTDQEKTHQEQYRATGEQKQYGVKIKQERHDEASGPSGHILVTCEPVTVNIEPAYCRTMLSVKCEPADQQSTETDLQSLESS